MAKNVAVRRRKATRTAEEIQAILVRRKLTVPQRLAVHAIVMTTTHAEALALLHEHGIDIDKATLRRWAMHGTFRDCLYEAEAAVAASINRNSVLRKSEAALEVAMKGTPILGYVGKDEQEIVGYKPDLPSAARLIEIQGKAVGAFGDDGSTKIAILVDVDFSGRKDPPGAAPVIDVQFEDVISQPRPTGSGLASDERDDSWLE